MKQEIIDFFRSLHLHKKLVLEAGIVIGDIPEDNLFNHDASKFWPEEYPFYARQFHGDKGDPNGWARAWLHHIHHNPHHWQHWIFPDAYMPKGSLSIEGAMPMPIIYAREMVADWMGASRAYTNSWDMSDWLNKHLPWIIEDSKMLLHPDTEEIIMAILFDLGYQEGDNSPSLYLGKYG